jgi:hypothetical protein
MQKRRAGKQAPAGYYTASEAAARLGLNRNTFFYYVRAGKIKKYVPPMRSEGYYNKKEVDTMATEIALYLHLQEEAGTETRLARSREDAQGIVEIMQSLGWQHATIEQYLAWWEVNPNIHYIVTDRGQVMGNLACVPYTAETIEERLAGRKRAWHVTSADIRPYEPGTYDVWMGIEVRQDVPDSRRYAFRLISGFLSFLEDLAKQGIFIRRIYGVSAEPPGQKLARNLGFVEQPHEPGDLYENWQRLMLDLETSPSHFAQLYRASLASIS